MYYRSFIYRISIVFSLLGVSGFVGCDTAMFIGDLASIKYISKKDILKQDSGNKSLNFVSGVPSKYLEIFDSICYYFPELSNEDITLVLKKIKTTMQAKPTNLLGKVKYIIVINNDVEFVGIKFDNIPHTAKIGIIAHELCHILDYKNK